ncbi:hypothetical protein PM01_00860 [Sulfitobacter pontiacus 3SOLIMAR09]|nr:hypothetical protein PM01_00860 [Sulfitobacter pontiacus 3SOLIMAR09]
MALDLALRHRPAPLICAADTGSRFSPTSRPILR